MTSYTELIYQELGSVTPKAQYEYLVDLKERSNRLAIALGHIDFLRQQIKIMMENDPFVDSTTKSQCEIILKVSNQTTI